MREREGVNSARSMLQVQLRIEGCTVLVTGGATGLGRAFGEELARQGAAVAINYLHSGEAAHALAATIAASGGRAIAVQGDVGDPQSIEKLVSNVEAGLGPIDILVNNAGITRYVPFPDISSVRQSDWDSIMRVNLVGAFLCAQAVAPKMIERGQGKILNVSSSSAISLSGSSIPYVVSKAALASLTVCLARALAPHVQVNAVAPGWMLTPWVDKYLPREMAAQLRSGDVAPIELGDVVDCGLALIANDSINGQVVVLDTDETQRPKRTPPSAVL